MYQSGIFERDSLTAKVGCHNLLSTGAANNSFGFGDGIWSQIFAVRRLLFEKGRMVNLSSFCLLHLFPSIYLCAWLMALICVQLLKGNFFI